jgi:hypothetical protein
MGELDKVAHFIEGLKPATKMEASYQVPATFEEAWTLAIKFDTAIYGIGKPSINSNVTPSNQSNIAP